jgi:hypothetical protein
MLQHDFAAMHICRMGTFLGREARKMAQTFPNVGTRFPSLVAPAVKKASTTTADKRMNPLTRIFGFDVLPGMPFEPTGFPAVD